MAEDKTDRLSSLPDDIRDHILSFLPDTKHRARTALLSKSWRYSWAHHQDIEFTLPPPIDPAKASANAHAIDRCLQAYSGARLLGFDIQLWSPSDRSPSDFRALSRWFRFAASRSVMDLYVTGRWQNGGRLIQLPPCIFSCRSLQTLGLFHCTFPEIPSDCLGFPSLRTLYINDTEISSQALDVLLSTSPALEELELSFFRSKDGDAPYSTSLTKPIRFSSRNIEKIKLRLSAFPHRIEIDAPCLTSILFEGHLAQLSLNCSPALTNAYLFDTKEEAFDTEEEAFGKHSDWMELVSSISQVETLHVNGWFFQFTLQRNYARDLSATFKNLKLLNCRVNWLTKQFLHALASVFRACPSLSDLSVQIDCHRMMFGDNTCDNMDCGLLDKIYEGEEDQYNPSDLLEDFGTPLCQLKTVAIRGFVGTRNEMKLVNFILKQAVSLRTLTIFHLRCDTKDIHALISEFARASSQVQICAKHEEITKPNDDSFSLRISMFASLFRKIDGST